VWAGGGACRVVWLKGDVPTKLVASTQLFALMDQDSAPGQTMGIARLRPWPFSSTTVALAALASCSSDHFPKRPIYISDVREGGFAPGPRLT